MNENLNKLKSDIVNFLSKDESKLDEFYVIQSSKKWSRRDIINEIKNDTTIGNDFVNGLILLSLDLLDRGKKEINIH